MLRHRLLCWFLLIGLWLQTPAVRADIANFDFAGQIFTKWLYRNNDSQGILFLGNPAFKDNFSGDNGVASEFEMTIRGKVSRYVTAGVRIKSRFGALWHNWWENGDLQPLANNTGESLGMNHAEYMKLRGYWFRIRVPVDFVNFVHVGSSDYSEFNAWTVGKVRFIDRDNGKGIFVDGKLGEWLHYYGGVIPLPKMWIGPGWTTGLGDTALTNPFYSQDYAYAVRLDFTVTSWFSFNIVSMVAADWEANRYDPDSLGTLNPTGAKDGAVSLANRFFTNATTLDAKFEIGDKVTAYAFAAYTYNRINDAIDPITGKAIYATNRIPEGGFFSYVWPQSGGLALRGRVFIDDPFDAGLSFKLEGFYIGSEFNSAFGARRETDVLLTDGFLGGDQVPTLNVANEFMDFDERWAESIIGWAGGTFITELARDSLKVLLEGTFITYTTNNPTGSNGELVPRPVDSLYPSYPGLHTGLTDLDFFNNVNRQDFGRDSRNVYRRYQDRYTVILRLALRYTAPVGRGLELIASGKYIRDVDTRQKQIADDDYVGDLIFAHGAVAYPIADWLRVEAGFHFYHWRENRVFGNDEQGYSGFITNKYKPYLKLGFDFGGVKINYYLEYIHRDLLRDRHISDPAQRILEDRYWRVWRSKATASVAW